MAGSAACDRSISSDEAVAVWGSAANLTVTEQFYNSDGTLAWYMGFPGGLGTHTHPSEGDGAGTVQARHPPRCQESSHSTVTAQSQHSHSTVTAQCMHTAQCMQPPPKMPRVSP